MERSLPWASRWQILVDTATVVWLAIFFVSLTRWSPLELTTASRIGLGLLAVFVVDLGVVYYEANLRPIPFLRREWVAVLLVIPYFRIFRIFRILRFARFVRTLRLIRQPRPGSMLRLAKPVLSGLRAGKKGKRVSSAATRQRRQHIDDSRERENSRTTPRS